MTQASGLGDRVDVGANNRQRSREGSRFGNRRCGFGFGHMELKVPVEHPGTLGLMALVWAGGVVLALEWSLRPRIEVTRDRWGGSGEGRTL